MKNSGLAAFPVRRELGEIERALTDTLTGLARENAAARMWQHDASFWTRDPAHRKSCQPGILHPASSSRGLKSSLWAHSTRGARAGPPRPLAGSRRPRPEAHPPVPEPRTFR